MSTRLLTGVHADGRALSAAEHLRVHGALAYTDLVDEVCAAGLTGRGGAGFPAGRKLAAARAARGRATVVVNGAEGEPAIAKDRTLLSLTPHLVLDGAQVAATAAGAREVVVAVHAGPVVARVAAALGERRGDPVPATLLEVPGGYTASESSSLANLLAGGPARPVTTARPLALGGGPTRRPLVVSNAETVAHLALIGRHGAAAWRAGGTDDDPGTRLLTVRGAVRTPGVLEVPGGTTLAAVLLLCGAGPADAALLGGYAGRWVRLADAATTVPRGAGLVAVVPRDDCPLAAAAEVVTWLAGQGARQCGPCVLGLPELARAMADVVAGRPADDVPALARLVARRGACAHPDGVAGLVLSTLEVLADEVALHRARGPCGRPAGDALGVPGEAPVHRSPRIVPRDAAVSVRPRRTA